MIKFQRAILDQETIKQLIDLSYVWFNEDCSYGMRPNTKDDIYEACYIALDDKKIVGYGFGHYYTEDSKKSCIEVGSKCFEIDELYVLPNYRNQGIGKQLFKMLQDEVKEKIDYLTLATSTKDYKKALNFYAEQNNMNYHSAFLFKKMK